MKESHQYQSANGVMAIQQRGEIISAARKQ